MEERLDKILVSLKLAASRERARTLIEAGHVRVNSQMVTKPGRVIDVDASIELLQQDMPWVSRGALKLLEALKHFDIDVAHKIAIDVGASTGGFTEVLLSKNVKKVYCVDVGHDQLAAHIKEDDRVINLEKTNIKILTTRIISEKCDICVIDVSFISLTKVLPFVTQFMGEQSSIIALIKPQFEVGKKNLNNKGVVKNKTLYHDVIASVQNCAANTGFPSKGLIESPILGGGGNKEFLIWLKKETS
jgi:23S rRNA (cytidine1920-2'-O)/16S rRNA (cytidine1409-2'-O)-methyltransferase